MTLIEAINHVADGYTIVSNADKTYTHEILSPIWCGPHYAAFNTCGMTESERKGEWHEVIADRR